MAETLHRTTARRVALAAAAGFPPRYSEDVEGAAEFIRRVGYVQIDTISVVARAHEHVMWSRCGRFSAAPFAELEGKSAAGAKLSVESSAPSALPRRIFEYWAHAAAYLPIEDFRYSLPRMERIRHDGHEWFRADGKTAAEVLARVRAEGPLSSRDFEDTRGKASSWWDWKPAKRALEYLFHAGELLVATRVGFNKVFDLAERVLPAGADLRFPSAAEAASRHVDRAVDAYGIFTEDEVAYGRKDAVDGIGAELASRVEDGRLSLFQVEDGGSAVYYASPPIVQAAAEADARSGSAEGGRRAGRERPRVFILSPFDPFVIDRRRVRRLFGFDYTIECYVSEAKRRFGYFSLPILDASLGTGGGEGFVGLVDAKADRKARTLIVKRIALGESAGLDSVRGRGFADLAREVGRSLAEYARFNGAERIVFDRIDCPTGAASAALVKAAEKGF